ncbi:hypothetical protein BV898_02931 [Hypsibius exemplaris]|uniref:Uncharacterized protein n=1 Tax=Hypsibius exemplaris TaxID=2072580 RepID=A0A1W0X718_HYPEX|nr:hypothetical protein BV898_02931 [Hypsibius exemplaris]
MCSSTGYIQAPICRRLDAEARVRLSLPSRLEDYDRGGARRLSLNSFPHEYNLSRRFRASTLWSVTLPFSFRRAHYCNKQRREGRAARGKKSISISLFFSVSRRNIGLPTTEMDGEARSLIVNYGIIILLLVIMWALFFGPSYF